MMFVTFSKNTKFIIYLLQWRKIIICLYSNYKNKINKPLPLNKTDIPTKLIKPNLNKLIKTITNHKTKKTVSLTFNPFIPTLFDNQSHIKNPLNNIIIISSLNKQLRPLHHNRTTFVPLSAGVNPVDKGRWREGLVISISTTTPNVSGGRNYITPPQ